MPAKLGDEFPAWERGAVEVISAIFSGFIHPVIVKDEHSRFVHVNAPACALLGVSADQIVGRTDHDFLPKEEADTIVAVDQVILASGEERIFEESITPSQGGSRTLVTHKHRVALPGSGEKLVVVVLTDVTDLRQAERVLRESEEHYRSLVELHPQVPWVANAAGEVIEVGPTWSRLSGRAPEAAYGSGWETAVHPDDLPAVQQLWVASVTTGNSFDVECRICGPDGGFRWVRNRAAARRDEHGRVVRWYGLLEDVHERKSAEEAMRESESRFRLIADSVPVMIWMTDANGSTTYLNRNWLETTGQTEEQALGQGWLDAVHPDDRDIVSTSFEEASRTRASVQAEYRLRRKDGSWAWVIDVGEPRLAPDGRLLGYAGSVLDLSERRASEVALEESEAFIRSIFDSSPDCVRLLDLHGEPLLMNRAGREMFGLSDDADLKGQRWDRLIASGDAAKVQEALTQAREGKTARFEASVKAINKKDLCVDVIAAPVFGKDGTPIRILTIWRDITDAKAARDATEEARAAAEVAADTLAVVLESTLDCVVVVDHDWQLTYLNSNSKRLLGLGDEAIGQNLWSLYPEERNGVFATQYKRALAANQPVTFEEYLPSLGLWLEVHASPTEEGLSIFFRDTSERRRAEQERFQAQAQILHMSRHDALTNLPNRLLLRERLERSLSAMAPGAQLAVLTLDLDGFKPVNDTYGHPVGDMLLRQVADRLHGCIREEDTVARVGGDEFVIVQPVVRRSEDADLLAKRIIENLQKPFDLEGLVVSIGTSVGLAFAPAAGTTVDDLIRASDVALYRAKADGRGTFRRYAAGMDVHMQARQELKVALRNALARNELDLFFQPLVDLSSSRVSSCEALVRWRHPDKGMVSPADFIPVAEETGLIIPIGEWVLRTACEQASGWEGDIGVAVNLSPLQFKDGDLVKIVSDALEASGLAPSRLQLEITESVMLDENEANLHILQELRHLGVKIAMDDFGTGYSSLGYLRSFPFDKIKVDRGFISDLPEGKESLAIVRAVAGIGRSLGITTTVEGVETQEQLDAVNAEGFDEAQGYLFSRPVPAADIPDILRRMGS
ncbi:diguanylate cyclase (GGDEF)-like protein/PAS domain S-box-containing protein [Pseudorhizobium tarimense]|uniref:Diguanylate cyclase (GGDEF)-like protein/PAS domain S-box-containing protein n=1 Tax=Pseudorhizobium tarimense TaxID=1079109 RepID=A0ABV2HD28_9HYPH|nr:PAS domain S-box protein [Pseudorhizobium tarimense]MCJ8521462.1 PAS domain S-box protein [Pseudorhizobium tarimense]